MPISLADKRATFRKLHESGCFPIPNPFDVGSAKALAQMGFKALASTSAGFAWTIGKADNRVTVDDVCAHLTELCAGVDLPVNADFENGFAHEPEKVAANVARGAKTGVAGLSIEDSTGDAAKPLYDRSHAIERITREQITAVVKAAAPKPVNLLIGPSGLSVAEAADLGVRRISVGGSLARTAWAGFMRAAKEIAEQGTFTELAKGYPGVELNKMFR
jgi:methylisocitrate lyase